MVNVRGWASSETINALSELAVMSDTAVDYVQKTTDGTWRLVDSRVSLDSVVQAYWDGKSPEAIAEEFPTLRAESVYGAIAFYLRHQREIDDYLSQQSQQWDQLQRSSETQHGPLFDRIRARRKPRPETDVSS
jgi:uncharacterized protein (DUF433 family)